MIRLAVRCGPAAAERVLAELLQLAPGGVEEEQGPGWVEYAIYGAEGELPDLGAVEAVAGDEPIEVSSAEVPDDWGDRWRDFHRPVQVAGGRVVIRPSWETNPLADPAAPGREAEEVAELFSRSGWTGGRWPPRGPGRAPRGGRGRPLCACGRSPS